MPLALLIAGGGTGGHLFPGIAVAREVLTRAADSSITFVGTAAGIEARVVPHEGFQLELIRSAGLKGKSLTALARGISLLPLSAVDAWGVLSRVRPSVVIGVGGYSSGPVVALAALRGIPTLLMEQNAVPGLTNRWLAPFVNAAAVSYEETARFFGGRAFVSGNPVRPAFLEPAADHGRRSPGATRVLVFGGSQGAHALNLAMVEAAERLAAAAGVEVTHQTGDRDLEMVRDRYRRVGLEAKVEPFLFSMDRVMREADVIVCRAGATTLAELMASGRPSILVPLPTATDDHQRQNARMLVAKGAAQMIEQRELTGDRLAVEILALVGDADKRREMSTSARQMSRPNAARTIVNKVLALAR